MGTPDRAEPAQENSIHSWQLAQSVHRSTAVAMASLCMSAVNARALTAPRANASRGPRAVAAAAGPANAPTVTGGNPVLRLQQKNSASMAGDARRGALTSASFAARQVGGDYCEHAPERQMDPHYL